MNREKRDKIPSMQVSFIDAICIQLYEVIQPIWLVVARFFVCRKNCVWWIASRLVANKNGEHSSFYISLTEKNFEETFGNNMKNK